MTNTYRLVGTDLRTDLALPCRLSNADAPVSVTVSARGDVPAVPAAGELLAELAVDGELVYSVSRQSDADVLRIPGLCDLRLGRDGTAAEFVPSEDADLELLGIILAGAGVSTMLALQGLPIYHGSAVAHGGRSIAFLGESGQGKSTMTALFCMAGWSFVCDDVLRAELTASGEALVYPGGLEIRLREKALRDASWPTRTTVDGRAAVAPPAVDGPKRLDAFVIPIPTRETEKPSVELLSPGEAAEAIRYYQRIAGWRDMDLARQFFSTAVDLAQAVPVWVANVPWDDELSVGVVNQLVDLLAAPVS